MTSWQWQKLMCLETQLSPIIQNGCWLDSDNRVYTLASDYTWVIDYPFTITLAKKLLESLYIPKHGCFM